jgi:hypothetical protein
VDKVIQKITAWGYPCDGKFLEFKNEYLHVKDNDLMPCSRRKRLLADVPECPCGKHCNHQKIVITVGVANG